VTSREDVAAMVGRSSSSSAGSTCCEQRGLGQGGPVRRLRPCRLDRIIAINLYGVLHTCKAVLPIMAGQGGGTVVNLASDAGRVGSSGEAVYAAAEGWDHRVHQDNRQGDGAQRINANAVCPGPTDTPLFASIGGDNPKLREALIQRHPAAAARAAVRPRQRRRVPRLGRGAYVTGQTVSVSGGLTMS
jgi:2-hydroxycyclohexanecarboxyl-CoA dehydrogenase